MKAVSITLKICRYVYDYRWRVCLHVLSTTLCGKVCLYCLYERQGIFTAYMSGFLHKKFGWNIGENGI